MLTVPDLYYYVQRQAPAGNWVDVLGVEKNEAGFRDASIYSRAQKAKGANVRIVEKSIIIVEDFTK